MEQSLRVSIPVALFVLLVCSAEAMNYLAFPRMGRSGYLAFPRMGRSQGKTETEFGNCCGVGLKSEFVVAHDGKEEVRPICSLNADCCPGLRELADQKPDGSYYLMCVPDFPFSVDTNGPSSEVLKKLKSLMAK